MAGVTGAMPRGYAERNKLTMVKLSMVETYASSQPHGVLARGWCANPLIRAHDVHLLARCERSTAWSVSSRAATTRQRCGSEAAARCRRTRIRRGDQPRPSVKRRHRSHLAQLAFPRDALMRFIDALDLIFRLPLSAGQLPDHLKHIPRHVRTSCLHHHRLTDSEFVRHRALPAAIWPHELTPQQPCAPSRLTKIQRASTSLPAAVWCGSVRAG
jgi:hypothetical protein